MRCNLNNVVHMFSHIHLKKLWIIIESVLVLSVYWADDKTKLFNGRVNFVRHSFHFLNTLPLFIHRLSIELTVEFSLLNLLLCNIPELHWKEHHVNVKVHKKILNRIKLLG